MIITTSMDSPAAGRPKWKEMIILWFYFTFLSNFLGVIVPALVLFRDIKKDNKKFQYLKTLMAVNLTLTMIVYWALLSKNIAQNTPQGIFSTSIIHAATPLLSIFTYFFDGYKNSISNEKSTIMDYSSQ